MRLYLAATYALFPCEIIYNRQNKPIKKPKVTGWQLTVNTPDLNPQALGEVYGVSLKDDDVVIDIDRRHFRPGHHESKELWRKLNLPVPRFIVETGNGWHFYYKKSPALLLRSYIPDTGATPSTCITLKRTGEYVVAAGSRHPSGKIYTIVAGDPSEHEQFPQALAELCQMPLFNYEEFLGKEITDDSSQTIEQYIRWLDTTKDISIEGNGGDLQACRVANYGKRLGLSQDTTFQLMWKHWNNRCKPPWDHQELARKCHNGYQYFGGIHGEYHTANDFDEHVIENENQYPINSQFDAEQKLGTSWSFKKAKISTESGVTYQDTDKLLPILSNAVNFFVLPLIDSLKQKIHNGNGEELYKLLRFNHFSNHIEFVKLPPWHNPQFTHEYWEDSDLNGLMHLMSLRPGFECSAEIWQRTIEVVARAYGYHPVRNYLNALKWDGVPRLDTWLVNYAGADDDLYCREVGKNTLIALVARIFQPGEQHDHMLVLEGKQGTGKSSIVQILGGQWYANIPIDPHNKDTVAGMQGAWVLEASELEFLKRNEIQAVKDFISKKEDKVRLAYARNVVILPRQCGFIGTINPDATGCYLQDTTGNRRFWPVKTRNIDLVALSENRDQLFAEAVVRYKQGEKWYITDPHIQKLAISNQYQRLHGDLWTEAITQWLRKPEDADFPNLALTTNNIAFQVLSIPVKECTRSVAIRIAKIMKDLGYAHKQLWNKNTKSKIWIWELDCLGDL